MGNLLRCHGDTSDEAANRRHGDRNNEEHNVVKAPAESKFVTTKVNPDRKAENPIGGDSPGYAEKARIDDEVLVARYLHLMDPTVVGGVVGSHRHDGSGETPSRRNRVSFRAESFDSQSSTTSERREFILDLVDSLPETFVDDALPPASARGRLTSWSSCSEVFVDCSGPDLAVTGAAHPKIALVA